MFEVKRYEPSHEQAWNDFVARSKNGTFLFDRRFMDYHSDRFADSSLMILRKGRIYALLPANRVGDTLHSHQGLTYGGLLTDAKATAEGVMEAFDALNAWLRNEGVRRVTYKAMPWIYHRLPAEEPATCGRGRRPISPRRTSSTSSAICWISRSATCWTSSREPATFL